MDLIESVVKAYWEQARYFAIGHGVLAIFVAWSLISFARCKFDDEPSSTIWQQFEIQTNFIRGLIGLFLIIGIAGTFLGLWEVASALDRAGAIVSPAGGPSVTPTGTPDIGATAQSDRTIRLLFSGIAKAFPVGFVGLLLTLLSNLVADLVERSKRKQIEAFLANVKDPVLERLTMLLEPLASLGTVLDRSLQPVINKLADALAPIPMMMAEQRNELSSAKDALVGAAEALKASGTEISSSVDGLQNMAKTSRQALENATKLSKRIDSYFDTISVKLDAATNDASTAFQSYDVALAVMTNSVQEASTAMRELPAQLRTDLADSLTASFNASSKVREDALNDMYSEARQSFRENMANAMSDVTTDLQQIKAGFEKVAKDVDTSVANAQNSFQVYEEAWKEDAAKLREQIVAQIDPGFRDFIAEKANETQAALDKAAESARDLTESTRASSEKIDRVYRDTANQLTSAAELLAQRLSTIARVVESSAARLEDATRRATPGGARGGAPIRTLTQKIGDVLRHSFSFGSRRKKKK